MDTWENARSAPMDGTPIDVRFADDKGEYPGFAVYWDKDDRCWRNYATRARIVAALSRWRPHVERRRRRSA